MKRLLHGRDYYCGMNRIAAGRHRPRRASRSVDRREVRVDAEAIVEDALCL
jgi:hypothetical protein